MSLIILFMYVIKFYVHFTFYISPSSDIQVHVHVIIIATLKFKVLFSNAPQKFMDQYIHVGTYIMLIWTVEDDFLSV